MVKKEEFLKKIGEKQEGHVTREVSRDDFPPNFVFGVATSAYQIEGAHNEGGRGPSIWDAFTHTEGKIIDGSNGDVAVDHYHRYMEDIDLIAKLGFQAYRFSISWSRIFPDGLGTKVNYEGIAFYNGLINAILERDTCFASFGDRVKYWITINEPLQTAVNGYDTGINAPGRSENASTEPYLAAHHEILAHAAAVSIYRSKYKEKQGGQVGLVVDCEWAEANSDKIEDISATARRLDFQIGWFLHPLFYGDYPEVMRERLGDQLPKFSEEEKMFLLNSLDFIGVNHYTTRFISHTTECTEENHFYKVQQMERIVEWEDGEAISEKAASEWLYIVPWGLQKTLTHISQKYKATIYVTENGMDDEDNDDLPLHEKLDDKQRVRYYKGYIDAVAQAIKDGADVRGYFAWSILDNFEWSQGYTKRFGLLYVDYKNGLTRHPKSSAYWFSRFLKSRQSKKGKED
ncbi:hypothetical protein L6164_023059 [Bauhinia variegata]|uniref:Uncharacterized protein n=1 Tax=Bauhinia variegata TaxID=167791 RepID=A0ACB9MIE5_BAUVA|nr:hypothetical protein L6164_023059 [Bauhinia variegata]